MKKETFDKCRKVLRLMNQGFKMTTACQMAKINSTYFYEMMKKYPQLRGGHDYEDARVQ
jgi:hypothetical protein